MVAESLLDNLRARGHEQWRAVRYAGFDPDLGSSGLAIATVAVSTHGRRALSRLDLWEIKRSGKARGLQAANAMVEQIHAMAELFIADEATVEGQQVYPDPKMERAEILAKANDLVMLAHVSGAAMTAFLRSRTDAQILLPAQWKGNRSKEAMHPEIIKMATAAPVVTVNGNREPASVAGIHALDAAGMALRRAGWKV